MPTAAAWYWIHPTRRSTRRVCPASTRAIRQPPGTPCPAQRTALPDRPPARRPWMARLEPARRRPAYPSSAACRLALERRRAALRRCRFRAGLFVRCRLTDCCYIYLSHQAQLLARHVADGSTIAFVYNQAPLTAPPAPSAAVVVGDSARPLPFPSGSFDIVLSLHTLQYVEDVGFYLRQAARVLKVRVCVDGGNTVDASDHKRAPYSLGACSTWTGTRCGAAPGATV